MELASLENDHSSEREQEAIEGLLSCSQDFKEDSFEDFVVTSAWEEVCRGWRNTKPNARYISTLERRKKSKEKARNSPPFLDPDSQLAKVKKLAGLITSSNALLESNSSSKTGPVKNPCLSKYQNTDVLSYDVPHWRYIVDPKRYKYIERPAFQLLRTLSDRRSNLTQTILLDNGGMITCQEANGHLFLLDPALSFDKHLLDTLDLREEFKLRSGHRCAFEFSSITQIRKEDNKIKVIHALAAKPSDSNLHCNGVCDMCRHRTQELMKNDIKVLSPGNSFSETNLKPLQKVTPTQRRVAEDSILAGKVLMQQSRSKELLQKVDSGNKLNKKKDGKVRQSQQYEPKLDWLPITRNTIGYPYTQNIGNGQERVSHGRFPDRPSAGTTKAVTLPRNKTKARKLTLSEAANLVPKTSVIGDAINRLSKRLAESTEKPLSIAEPMLPSVSGTKLEVAPGACDM